MSQEIPMHDCDTYDRSRNAETAPHSVLRHGLAALALAACLAGCAQAPTLSQSAAELPPVAAGAARLYVYRDAEAYETLAEPAVYLDGRTIGTAVPGGVFYRDVPPGTYRVSVWSPTLFPNQSKTVTLQPGQTGYVKIESLESWGDGMDFGRPTFVVAVMDAASGQAETRSKAYEGGGPLGATGENRQASC